MPQQVAKTVIVATAKSPESCGIQKFEISYFYKSSGIAFLSINTFKKDAKNYALAIMEKMGLSPDDYLLKYANISFKYTEI